MTSLSTKPKLSHKLFVSPLKDLTPIRMTQSGSLFGVELEMENSGIIEKFPDKFGQHWDTHQDNSLRNNGLELVTRGGMKLDVVLKGLETVQELYKSYPKLDFSDRTSCHVHLNFGDATVQVWLAFTSIYYLLEDAFTLRAGGEKRMGNHFCLRAKDSTYILNRIRRFLLSGDFSLLSHADDYRYLGLNHASFRKFGTLELRCHRGTNDVEDFSRFLLAVDELYQYSFAGNDLKTDFIDMKNKGYVKWLEAKLPLCAEYLRGERSASDLESLVKCGRKEAFELVFGYELVEKDTRPKKSARDTLGELYHAQFREIELAARQERQPVQPNAVAAATLDLNQPDQFVNEWFARIVPTPLQQVARTRFVQNTPTR